MLIGLSSAVGRILHLEFGLLGLHLRWKMKVKCFHNTIFERNLLDVGYFMINIHHLPQLLLLFFTSSIHLNGYFGQLLIQQHVCWLFFLVGGDKSVVF